MRFYYLILVTLLMACSQDHVEDHREQIIIYEGNDITYDFSYFGDANMGYVTRDNGDRYSFELGKGITLTSSSPMLRVIFYEDVMDMGTELEIVENTVYVRKNKGIFRVWRE